MVEPRGFPAEFDVGQEIRLIGRQRRVAVDATRTIALGPGEIDHGLGRDMPGQIDLVERPALLHPLVEVQTGRALEWLGRDAAGLAVTRAGEIALAETEEAVKAAAVAVIALADRAREDIGDEVPRQFAVHRLVAIVADLPAQIEGVRPAGNRQRIGQAADLVLVLDIVFQLLPERASDQTQAIVAGRDKTQFVAVVGVVIAEKRMLRRIDQVSAVIVKIDTGAVQRVVPE